MNIILQEKNPYAYQQNEIPAKNNSTSNKQNYKDFIIHDYDGKRFQPSSHSNHQKAVIMASTKETPKIPPENDVKIEESKLNSYTDQQLCTYIKNFSQNFLSKNNSDSVIYQYEIGSDLYTPSYLAMILLDTNPSTLQDKFHWGTILLFLESLSRNSHLKGGHSLLNILCKAEISNNKSANKNLNDSKKEFLSLQQRLNDKLKEESKKLKEHVNATFTRTLVKI